MIDFSATIDDYDGRPIPSGAQEGAPPLTLRDAVVRALVLTYEDERNLDPKQKFERGELAARVYGAAEPMTLRSEDVALVKKLVGKAYSPLVVFRAWPMLDAAEGK